MSGVHSASSAFNLEQNVATPKRYIYMYIIRKRGSTVLYIPPCKLDVLRIIKLNSHWVKQTVKPTAQ